MDLLLQRRPTTGDAILGELFVNGAHECWTLEHAGLEIAPGRYPVTITHSAKFGKMLPLISDVPGRSGLRIHSGNVAGDSCGCILVGLSETSSSVMGSRLALAALQSKLAWVLARSGTCWITIEGPLLT